MLRGRSFLTRANIILYILLEEDFWGSVSKKGSFSLSTKVRVFLKPASLYLRKNRTSLVFWTINLFLKNKTAVFLHKSTLSVACRYQLAHPLCPCGLWPAISYCHHPTQHVASLLLWQDGMPGHARQDTGGVTSFSSIQKCIEKRNLFSIHFPSK